jgi:AcrR family transcriptional regulator
MEGMDAATPGPGKPRAERVEIRRSREAILAAAEAHWNRTSVDPAMSELAQLAGVGNATLWRRFGSIEDVVRALSARHIELLDEVAAATLAQPTGWDAIVTMVTGVATLIEAHPALPRISRRMVELEPGRRPGVRWEAQIAEIVRRAHEEGALRADAEANDILLAAFRVGDYGYLPSSARPRVIARQVAIVLDGLRADGERVPLPGEVITPAELQRFFQQPLD